MKIRSTSITIKDIKIFAYHGILDQERRVGNDFLVNVSADIDARTAVLTDHLSGTINYVSLIDVVRSEMAIPSSLIEHVTGRITRKLLALFPSISAISVTVTKIHPPISTPIGGASFTLHAERD